MAWTYGDNPATDLRDEVRLLIGDIDPNDQKLTDSQIQYAIVQGQNFSYKAAALAAELLVAKYASLVNTAVDSVRVDSERKMYHYSALASSLWDRFKKITSESYGVPYVGGLDADDMQANYRDTSRVQSAFKIGQFTNPGGLPNLPGIVEP